MLGRNLGVHVQRCKKVLFADELGAEAILSRFDGGFALALGFAPCNFDKTFLLPMLYPTSEGRGVDLKLFRERVRRGDDEFAVCRCAQSHRSQHFQRFVSGHPSLLGSSAPALGRRGRGSAFIAALMLSAPFPQD